MRTDKSEFTETEAAEELGISVEDFRVLIRTHILDREEDLKHVPTAMFQLSDLLILRHLAGRTG